MPFRPTGMPDPPTGAPPEHQKATVIPLKLILLLWIFTRGPLDNPSTKLTDLSTICNNLSAIYTYQSTRINKKFN